MLPNFWEGYIARATKSNSVFFFRKCLKKSTKFINKTNKTKMGKIKLQNRLERQNGAADNFFHKTKNSLRWILKGSG